ncbi:MAG: replicative DNA helicase [Candidatus Shikimatogenerans sp. Tduv]|uniref:Replicative DNA helicase n=1 Tax=Candidatus Shikimatogenerans sp. Tduv TaxID=3158567 RepID=A0AAU7QR41_9FLAO
MKNKKQLPNSIEIEKTVIAILLLNNKILPEIFYIINKKYFFNMKNRFLYENIKKLYFKYKKIDLLSLIDYLNINNKIKFFGGEKYIYKIINKVVDISNINYYINILKKKYILRKLIKISTLTIKKAYKEDIKISSYLYNIEKKIYLLLKDNQNKNFFKLKDIIAKIQKKILKGKRTNKGLLSGFKDLDKVTNGWQKSDLIIIAARPGMGKTSFALSMILNILKEKKSILFYSLEMSSKQLVNKLLSYETNINFYKIKNLIFKDKELPIVHKKMEKIKKYSLYIDDSSSLSILNFKITTRRYLLKYNIKLIIIDYLQLINVSSNKNYKIINREQEISIISKNLKCIAKELKIPIIAISQLSRAVEVRGGDKRPILSDLRESGAIEQDADMVIFIYRANYYYQYNTNKKYETTELIISKHRNGMLKTIKIKFIKKIAKFIN